MVIAKHKTEADAAAFNIAGTKAQRQAAVEKMSELVSGQAGPETDIIATDQTCQVIAEDSTPFYEEFKEGAAANLESARTDDEAAGDKSQRRDRRVWLDFYRGFAEADIRLPIRLPNLTFTKRLAFHGSQRTAELIPMGDGHSANDSVLWLAQDGVVFMSDLLFIGCHPYLGAGNPDSLLRILDAVKAMRPTLVVPGHGPARGARRSGSASETDE